MSSGGFTEAASGARGRQEGGASAAQRAHPLKSMSTLVVWNFPCMPRGLSTCRRAWGCWCVRWAWKRGSAQGVRCESDGCERGQVDARLLVEILKPVADGRLIGAHHAAALRGG